VYTANDGGGGSDGEKKVRPVENTTNATTVITTIMTITTKTTTTTSLSIKKTYNNNNKRNTAYLMISLVAVAERDPYVAFDRRIRFDSHHRAGIDPVQVAVLHGVQKVFGPHVFDFFYIAVGQPYQ